MDSVSLVRSEKNPLEVPLLSWADRPVQILQAFSKTSRSAKHRTACIWPWRRSAAARRWSRRRTGFVTSSSIGKVRCGPTLTRLAANYRLIRYDGRGLGLSDWDVADLSFEAYVDLEAVVDTLGLERFPLLGISGGVALSIAYAVRHPDRVSHLVLIAGFP